MSIVQYRSAESDSLLPRSIKNRPNIEPLRVVVALSHLDGFESNGALRKLLGH